MQIIEINYIDIEPAQTTFARFAHIIGLAADPAKLALIWITQNSKFRRYDDLSATSSQCAPEQLLIGVRAIHVGRIEECDAELERAMNCGERFFLVSPPIKIRHPHAPEADRRNDRAASSKVSLFPLLSASLRDVTRFWICEKLSPPRLIISFKIRELSLSRL